MYITVVMVLTYIVCCVRIGTAPWRYFQLNARYFSDEAGIFSKLSLDRLIPDRWRLPQNIDAPALQPRDFPVFLKPEWGQNAHGIHRADTPDELDRLRATLAGEPQRYLLQEAAPGAREFEIFGIDADRSDRHHDILTVTEAVNDREDFPINSKYNRHTRYVEVTSEFDTDEQQTLAGFLGEIGRFGITRMSVRSDSREALLAGEFKVIEINLFLPMPINLLDERYTTAERWRFIRRAMMALARSTKLIEPVDRERAIFTRMMFYGSEHKHAERVVNLLEMELPGERLKNAVRQKQKPPGDDVDCGQSDQVLESSMREAVRAGKRQARRHAPPRSLETESTIDS